LKESEAATNTKLIFHAAACCVIPSQCADMARNQTRGTIADQGYLLTLGLARLIWFGQNLSVWKVEKQTGADVTENLFEKRQQPIRPHSMLERWKRPPCQRRNHPIRRIRYYECV